MERFQNLSIIKKLFLFFTIIAFTSIIGTVSLFSGLYGADRNESVTTLILAAIAIYISTALMIYFFSAKATNPVVKLLNSVNETIKQNSNHIITFEHNDEIGQLAKRVHEFSNLISNYRDLLGSVSSPILSIDKDFNIMYINKSGADVLCKDKSSIIGTKCYDNFKTIDCRTDKCALAKAMSTGQVVSSETKFKSYNGDLSILYTGTPLKDKDGNIIGAVENITDLTESKEMEHYLEESTATMLKEIEKFANGDLTVKLIPTKDDNIGKLFRGFNSAITNVKDMIQKVMESIQTTASTSQQISSSAIQMAAGAQEQSQQTGEVATAVEAMTKTIYNNTQNVNKAAQASTDQGDIAKDGGNVVEQTISGMNKIAEVVEKSAQTVQMLGKNSNEIGKIIQVIDDIADQTNLLALNAAIEAARAGEQGRGFAVVADEVRKLAERTTKATSEIASMIKQIQKDTTEAVTTIQAGQTEVENGKHLAKLAGEALNKIIHGAGKVVSIVNQVAAASEEQSTTSEQISANIEMIKHVAEENALGINQMAEASEQLNNLTENLQQMVSHFNTINATDNFIHKGKTNYAVRQNGKLVKG